MDKKVMVSEAELAVMEVLWSVGEPATAFAIRQKLNETNDWERTTVLTLIQRLVKKGVIEQEKREVYYYSPLISREEYRHQETQTFINRMYKGHAKELIAALFQENNLTKQDIEELRDYFNQ